jgi:hypothetical protein
MLKILLSSSLTKHAEKVKIKVEQGKKKKRKKSIIGFHSLQICPFPLSSKKEKQKTGGE